MPTKIEQVKPLHFQFTTGVATSFEAYRAHVLAAEAARVRK